MKQTLFYIMVTILLIPILIALLFRLLLIDLNESFASASIGFFVAGIMLIEMKFAYRRPKKWGASNPIKAMFHKFNKPKLYRGFCVVNFLAFLLLSLFALFEGICS